MNIAPNKKGKPTNTTSSFLDTKTRYMIIFAWHSSLDTIAQPVKDQ
jgi:hypothetical protein